MKQSQRTGLALVFSVSALAATGWIFWLEDLRYALPTPRPEGLSGPSVGDRVALPAPIQAVGRSTENPTLLHFFNPHCPCSRFNVDHVRQLIIDHGDRVAFIAILQGSHEDELVSDFEGYGLGIPAVADPDGAIAESLGVYASPQAVILTAEDELYYRGNYNTSRYCTAPETQFARISLERLIAEERPPELPEVATVSYGCQLPSYERWAAKGAP